MWHVGEGVLGQGLVVAEQVGTGEEADVSARRLGTAGLVVVLPGKAGGRLNWSSWWSTYPESRID